MTHEQKKQVKDALLRYVSNFDTQTEAAESLNGVSPSTLSLIKNYNWDLLSDRLWQHIARQVGFYCGDWQTADTSVHMLLRILLGDAHNYAMAYGIAMAGGIGKTYSATQYVHTHEQTLYIAGKDYYNRKSFLAALLRICGSDPANTTAPEMLQQLTAIIATKDEPLLIIDDAHLLKDRVLHLVVLLANSVYGSAGIVIMGDTALRMRIIEGVRTKKPGFEDIYQTIGRRFITMDALAPTDIPTICRANGIHDDDMIAYICRESSGNLHTATCLIQQHVPQRMAA